MRPPARVPSVSTQPGARAFTTMLWSASSMASERVIATTAAFEALYSSWFFDTVNASTEAKNTMEPPPAAFR
ncbi:hypothetical protein D3C84_1050530 [compost metagenome]